MRSIGWVTIRVGEVLSSPLEPLPPFASPEPRRSVRRCRCRRRRPEPTGSKAPAPAAGAGAVDVVRPPTAPSAPGAVLPVVESTPSAPGAEAKRLVGLLADLLARGRLGASRGIGELRLLAAGGRRRASGSARTRRLRTIAGDAAAGIDRERLAARLDAGIDRQAGDRVDPRLGARLGAGVGAGVRTRVGSRISAGVGSRISAGVRARIGSRVRARIGSRVRARIGSGIRAGVRARVGFRIDGAGLGAGIRIGRGGRDPVQWGDRPAGWPDRLERWGPLRRLGPQRAARRPGPARLQDSRQRRGRPPSPQRPCRRARSTAAP